MVLLAVLVLFAVLVLLLFLLLLSEAVGKGEIVPCIGVVGVEPQRGFGLFNGLLGIALQQRAQ